MNLVKNFVFALMLLLNTFNVAQVAAEEKRQGARTYTKKKIDPKTKEKLKLDLQKEIDEAAKKKMKVDADAQAKADADAKKAAARVTTFIGIILGLGNVMAAGLGVAPPEEKLPLTETTCPRPYWEEQSICEVKDDKIIGSTNAN